MIETTLPFRLIVITDWERPDCLDRVRAIVGDVEGVAIEHRHPGATDRVFYEEGRRLREAIGNRAPLFVNRRVDVALALDAHVHLTEASIEVDAARRMLGAAKLISVSWHATTALRGGADLALLSPVFAPTSKRVAEPPLGVDRFAQLAATAPCPVFALGGVSPANVGALRGHAGVAAIGSVLHAADPVSAARGLL
jgi:thiamine-phosphate pyrophosphorylase